MGGRGRRGPEGQVRVRPGTHGGGQPVSGRRCAAPLPASAVRRPVNGQGCPAPEPEEEESQTHSTSRDARG
jgi:hypothetical protein